MAEFTQFTITDTAFNVASRFVEEQWFETVKDTGIFAVAYAIRHHFNDVNPGSLRYPGSGHNFSYSTYDPDGTWEELIKILYHTDTPRLYFRNLLIWGLEDIGKIIQENGVIQITDFIQGESYDGKK